MKKMFKLSFVLVMTMMLILTGCGGGKQGGASTAKGGGSNGEKTIHIFQYKVEIAEAMNRLKAEYETSHPGIKLDIQTVGGGSDYSGALKAKFAAGEQPDIFNSGGYRELDTWIEHLEDLSNEPWVSDVLDIAKEPMTKDGKLYGQPLNLEGYGFIYNKDLFAKAGITKLPTTLTELEAAAQKLKAAGIIPFSNGYQEWWVLGNHLLNIAFANQEQPKAFVAGLNDGSQHFAGNPVFQKWFNLFDLTLKYSNENPLTTDYNTQVTTFATGQAAMMQQGNWTQVQIDSINPKLHLGILPMPIDNDPARNAKLPVGVPSNWVINKNSPVKAEAKEFLNWMVSSETGKRYITKEFKFIPALKSIKATPEGLGDLAVEVMNYSRQNKTISWSFTSFPEGAAQEFGSSMQGYVAGKLNKEQLLAELQNTWNNLKGKK